MSISSPVGLALSLLLAATLASSAQTPAAPSVKLVVSVESHSGQPVPGLQAQDFSLTDNKAKRPITSFKAVTPAQEPVEVILLVDAVNARYSTVAFERDAIQKFLLANGGHLTYPTTLAVVQEQGGAQIQQGFSSDGKALNDSFAHFNIGLRPMTGVAGIYGADERLQISLTALHQVGAFASKLPGRKLILWISPGWPLLSGPGVNLGRHQQEAIFHDIAAFTNELRLSNITLDQINPLGPGEGILLENYYLAFEKGVAKPNEVALGNLGLQVLALHSGGLVLNSDSDVAAMLRRCLEDVASWYEITVDALPADRPIEYHHLEVKLAQPGYKVRTNDGYYAQP